jgi:hypothetical protein
MKPICLIYACLFAATLFIFGCDEMMELICEEWCPEIDLATDAGEVPPLDTDTEAPIPYEQPLVTIRVTNQSGTTKYLDNWYMDFFVEVGALEGDEWQPYLIRTPFCTANCEDVAEGDECCMDHCQGPPFTLFVLESPGSVGANWSGELFELNADHCSDCPCYQEVPTMTGTYRAQVCAYDKIECDDPDDCDPPPHTGPMGGAEVVGPATCYSVEFNVPYEDDEILISID